MKKLVPFIAAAAVAAGSYFAAGTPVGEALQIAFDADKAKAACVQLLEKGE